MVHECAGSFVRRFRSLFGLPHAGALPVALAMLAACSPQRPPPPLTTYEDLPVSGSVEQARAAGFVNCIKDWTTMRCRRDGVMLQGQGPFSAAVDLVGGDGDGGFDQLTLWHDRSQDAVLEIADTLKAQGWRECFTGEGARGDQAIYTLAGSPVWFSMDISYWGKRRFRVIPEWNKPDRRC